MKLLAGVEEVGEKTDLVETKNGPSNNNNKSTEKPNSVQPVHEGKINKTTHNQASSLCRVCFKRVLFFKTISLNVIEVMLPPWERARQRQSLENFDFFYIVREKSLGSFFAISLYRVKLFFLFLSFRQPEMFTFGNSTFFKLDILPSPIFRPFFSQYFKTRHRRVPSRFYSVIRVVNVHLQRILDGTII